MYKIVVKTKVGWEPIDEPNLVKTENEARKLICELRTIWNDYDGEYGFVSESAECDSFGYDGCDVNEVPE